MRKSQFLLAGIAFCYMAIPRFAFAQLPPTPQVQTPQIQTPQTTPQIQFPDVKVPKADDIPHVDTPETAHVALSPQAVRAVAAPIFRASIRVEPQMMDRAVYLRRECARLHEEIMELGFQIMGAGAADIALGDSRDTEPEWKWQQAREDLGLLNRYQHELEQLAGDDTRARQREQAYINNLRAETGGNYAVNRSDTTAVNPPQVHCEDEVNYTYEKVPVSAGFDSNGKPVYKMDWDVVPHKKRTCN